MRILLDDAKNPFGNMPPITGARGSTRFIPILPPGHGTCLHSHKST